LNIHAPKGNKNYVKATFYKLKFPKYHMKLLLGNFNAKVGREEIFKLMKVYTKLVMIMELEQ
jgi:hypothetical protein